MNQVKVIKTEEEYEASLIAIEELIDLDPDAGTEEADRLELLTLLVEDYESKHYPIELPDPIEAIRFRMEQQGLAQRDLVPYFGSRSKVSEVLNRKRPLTLTMIRALNSRLGIPAKVLLRESELEVNLDWNRFPIKEMIKRGWIEGEQEEIQSNAEQMLREFFKPLGTPLPLIRAVLYRKTSHVRSGFSMDEYALAAWTARIMRRAIENPPPVEYDAGKVDLDFMREIAKLSVFDDGPLLAGNFLREHGINLIIEPHLPGTHLDGAAIMELDYMPIIGLSLRFDRIDNFWFSLIHELAHISLHFGKEVENFYDDLKVDLDIEVEVDSYEREADEFAAEALIPQEMWEKSPASKLRSPVAAESLAKKLGIHPAIVAGRMRYEFKAYKLLSNLVGYNEVRRLFPEVSWEG